VLHLVWFAEFGRKVGSPRGGAHVGVGAFLMGVYQAPEAGNAKRPTQKSDVYSFGVVLLELLTGRSPFKQLAGGELDLVSWMRTGLQGKRALSEIFDPYLLKANNQQNKMIETLQVNWLLVLLALSPFARALHGVEQMLCNVEYM
jgi:serine/threonine protein kinase